MIQQSNVHAETNVLLYSLPSPLTIISPPSIRSHPPCITRSSNHPLQPNARKKTKKKTKHDSREVERSKAHASRATMVYHSCSSWSFRWRTAHHKYHPSYGQHSIFMFHRKNHGAVHSRILNHTNPASIHRPLRDLTDRSATILRGDINLFKRP